MSLGLQGVIFEKTPILHGFGQIQVKGSEKMSTVINRVFLQENATGLGNGTSVDMINSDILNIEVAGSSITTSTVVFEVAGTSGVFYPIQGVRLSDLTMASQTSTVGELWQFSGLSGLTFRTRISVLTGAGASLTVRGMVIA